MDNLARDAMAALRAGQTYGKWKAEHPHTRDIPAPVPVEESCRTKECCNCGKKFPLYGKSSSTKYCSDECKREAAKRRYMESTAANRATRICVICGKEYQADGRNRGTCSPECAYKNSATRRYEAMKRWRNKQKGEKAC